ncbi:MAG: alpha/beta hydrolase [Bacteroidales bacterium]|nr:alpha/beta hydrolase [Bacteroidales bacterium]
MLKKKRHEKKFLILLTVFCLLIISQSAKSQEIDYKAITGSWLGKINTGAIELRIVFNISLTGKDTLSATLDSPDQGAKNIKMGKVTYTGETLRIVAPMMLAEYNGTVKNDTLIEGTWKQAGNSLPLNIVKLKAAFAINRPQEPKAPFPYTAEDVTFNNDKFNIKLAGTLTMPAGKGPFPAVVLISGSGAQNRDEELMGHKPFLVIADYLTRNGIAVLRYDDRGVGKSQGSPFNATSADFATDAEAAFNFLRNNPDINSKAIGLIGHSEGGIIAPIVASSNKEIAFIVSLAGTGVSGEQIIHAQGADISRASGLNEKEIEENTSVNKKLFSVLKKESDNNKASEKILEEYKQILNKKKASPEETEKSLKQIQSSMNPAGLTWLRYFMFTDPAKFWKKVNCPVLALNGSTDLQVAADVNLPAIEKALKSGGNKNVKTVKLDGLNHLFQHSATGLPSEYGNIEETFSPEALKIISDWISGL